MKVYLLISILIGIGMFVGSEPVPTVPTTKNQPSPTNGPTTSNPPATTNTTTSTTTTTTTPRADNSDGTQCLLAKSSDNEKSLLVRVNDLKAKNKNSNKYEWEDEDHKYFFSVCATAENAKGKSDGFIQVNKKNNNTFVLGRLDDVDLEGVENIIRMAYNNGDQYQRACNRSERNAIIYLVCDPNQDKDVFKMIEENNAKEKGCAYIFELKSSAICSNDSAPTTPRSTTSGTTSATGASTTATSPNTTPDNNKETSKLGVVSIIMITLASVFVVYMSVGTFYLRFVNRARGWEQVPHINVWQGVGGRFADCCTYICRCGQRQAEVHSYENINDRISDDENLLNM